MVILRYLSLLNSAGRVAVSSGNHDLTDPDTQGEQAPLWLAEARVAGVPAMATPCKPNGSWADRLGKTWVFNAGRQIGLVPAHVEIDLVPDRLHGSQ